MKNYSNIYNTEYRNNAATIYFYKSDRKNAQIICHININHLINKKENRKVENENILNQLLEVVSKIVYSCKKYNYLRYTAYMDIFKKADYINANNEIYHGVDDVQIMLKNSGTIEQIINSIYDIFFLVYPYNTLSRKELFNNTSIKYFINEWYNKKGDI